MVTVLCTRLADQFEMEVVCDGQGDMPERVRQAGIPVTEMPLTTKWSFSANIPRLGALVRKAKPDVVHLHGQFAGSLGQIALQLAGRPKNVYTVQWPSYLDDTGSWSRLRNHMAERVSCGGATAVVAVSDHDRKELVARGLCDERKLSVIYNAYFAETDGSSPRPAPNPPVIGFVGRLVDQKGCEYMLRAAPRVLASVPAARFVIVGDGPERPKLEALARELNIPGSIEFAGYDPHPAQRMRSMTALAVPSIYEPLGMVALEAMASGLPVIGSAVGGIPEAVEDGKTGLLVPARDPDALATAIIRVLESPQIASAMGEAGRRRAQSRFSPEVVAGSYADLYRRLAASTSS